MKRDLYWHMTPSGPVLSRGGEKFSKKSNQKNPNFTAPEKINKSGNSDGAAPRNKIERPTIPVAVVK